MEYFLISATLNKAFLLSKNTELGKFLREYYQSIGVIFFKKRKVNDNAVVEGECWVYPSRTGSWITPKELAGLVGR